MKDLYQPDNSHKFSVDSLLLAQFAPIEKANLLVELGTGCGIILLEILEKKPELQGLGLDFNSELLACAEKNALLYHLPNAPKFALEDFNSCPNFKEEITKSFHKRADLVVCNPPWLRADQGKLSPSSMKKNALFATEETYRIFFKSARYFLKQKGFLAFISAPTQLNHSMEMLKELDFQPKEIQFVHHNKNSQGLFFMCIAEFTGKKKKIGSQLTIMNPIFLCENE